MPLSRRVMLTATLLGLVAGAAADPPKSGKYWVYLGTSTSKDGSKGIYRCELDAATGKLSEPGLAAEVGGPTFVHVAPDGKHLYAIGESNGTDGGGVHSWALDAATGTLSGQVSLTSKGNGPCHISTDAKNQFAVVANYGGGSTAFFKLMADGSLDSRIGFFQHTGGSVNPNRQKEPHAHCGFFDATGTLAFVCDLGTDKVMLYKLNRATGEVTANEPAFIKLPDGCGPRHLHLAPDNKVAFVNGELDMTVHVVKLDVPGNKFEVVQSLSTLPAGTKATNKDSTAETRIHPSGKFVYVSNRGHNTIAVFGYDAASTKLTPVGHVTGNIKIPRNFNISPCGKWLLVANQDGKRVGVFAIDEATGLAKETDHFVTVDRPMCVKFLAKP